MSTQVSSSHTRSNDGRDQFEFAYSKTFQYGDDTTEYECISREHVKTVTLGDQQFLQVDAQALELLAAAAMHDVGFYLRQAHLDKVAAILDDPEATDNDRYVAATLLRNSIEAADGILPTCQDTGTAICMGWRGDHVLVSGDEHEALSQGVYTTYITDNLRYSQNAPLSMFEETNTKCNLPAQIDLYASTGLAYKFLFLAKGGGSANKTFLYQERSRC